MMAAKNEGEAMKEYAEDMAKIMQVSAVKNTTSSRHCPFRTERKKYRSLVR